MSSELGDFCCMSTVKEIESALEQLPVEDLQEVRDWLDDFIEGQLELSDEFKAKVLRARQEIHASSPFGDLTPNDSATACNKELETRFRELSKKEALATISIEECEELERLANARRQFTNPRTTEEITRETAQSESLKRLLNALSEYVGSHESKNPART
jgi:hypothetical protein